MLCGISSSFPEVFPTSGQVTHVLLTRPPLNWRVAPPASFDLHVLSTPPAFILSQDQTLHLKAFSRCCHRSIRVNPDFFPRSQEAVRLPYPRLEPETLLFTKKQEK